MKQMAGTSVSNVGNQFINIKYSIRLIANIILQLTEHLEINLVEELNEN